MGCQYFGAMPYIDHSLSLTDNQYPRMPREEVTAKLLADLSDENIETLPLRHNQSQFGTARIGQVAAYGLRRASPWSGVTMSWQLLRLQKHWHVPRRPAMNCNRSI